MNRQIKFRAWDEERKVMINSVGFSDSDCGRVWQREAAMIDDHSYFASSDWIPMQFTGLLDKNGKEIYEGDILKPIGEVMKLNRLVEFVDGAFCYNLRETRRSGGYIAIGKHRATLFEIIGNIYENKDLLK